jgi:uncharacterized protein with HEPN domain
MKSRDYKDYLQDILDAADDVENFVDNLTYGEFIKDRKTLNAVIRSIEIIGEATKHIPETIRAKYEQVPWKQMAGMRDKLIHAYTGIDTETIWKAAKENIPQLKTTIQKTQKQQEKQ